jgi:heme-degrading monooxygenase HmoA
MHWPGHPSRQRVFGDSGLKVRFPMPSRIARGAKLGDDQPLAFELSAVRWKGAEGFDAQQVKYVALYGGQRREEAMMLRIIHGKLKPGTWDSYERAYKDVMAKAGKIPGLRGRWLAHAVDDPDAGYTMSLWENEAAMRSYENGEILQTTILPRLNPFFSGDYTTTRCEVRFAEEFDQ